jgi:hypothetical protein
MTDMYDEMESLEKNGTWSLVKVPRDKKPFRCNWFLIIKGTYPNNEARYKARLLTKGYS